LSKRTLTEFREWLVGWTLRTITDLFEGHGFKYVIVLPELLPGGQRRGLVECYYAGIDLKNPDHVRRLLVVFEDVLFEIPEPNEGKGKLVRLLERDGFQFQGGKIIDPTPKAHIDLVGLPTDLDTSHLGIYLDRINSSIERDPALAVGSAKELVEATLKSILRGGDVPFEESKDDIPVLLKKAQKHLDLAPDDIDGSKRGAETIKRVLSNLGSVAIGVAELRNVYGTGHGHAKRRAVDPRLARLVVGSAGTLCRFLLETYEARKRRAPQGAAIGS
jgi:hypothetical protein